MTAIGRTLIALTLVLALNPVMSQNASHFYGTIGEFPIEMELTNVDGTVSGWYVYPGKSQKLLLEGVLTSDNYLRLKESNIKGVLTGLFNGRFSSEYISKGTWQSADLAKEFLFELKLDNNISLNTGERMEVDKMQLIPEKGRLYEDSKIEGFSKLSLIVAVILFLGLVVASIMIVKYRKKAKSNPEVIHVTQIEKEVHYVNDDLTSSSDFSTTKGELFQEFIVRMFHNKKEYFHWIDATSDKIYGELYPNSNMNPDLIFRFRNENKGWEENIAVECKYRAGFSTKNDLKIDETRKIENYKNFAQQGSINTYLALGVGGKPDSPKFIYSIPINEVKEFMSF